MADEIDDNIARGRFRDLELEAWKFQKPEGVNAKYKQEKTVQTAAAKNWNKVVNKHELAAAIEAWNAQRAILAQNVDRDADDTFEDFYVRETDVIEAQQAYKSILRRLIDARNAEDAGADKKRTVDYLDHLMAENDRALEERPKYKYFSEVRECREQLALCDDLPEELPEATGVDELQELADTSIAALLARDKLETRIVEALEIIDKTAEERSDEASQYLESLQQPNFEAQLKIEKRITDVLEQIDKELKRQRSREPPRDETSVVALRKYVSYLNALAALLKLQQIQLQCTIRMYERIPIRAEDVEKLRGTLREVNDELATVEEDIEAFTPKFETLRAYERVYGKTEAKEHEKETKRKRTGALKHGWIAVGKTMDEGSQGLVQIWVKQNAQGLIIDRIVIKEAITGFPGKYAWNDDHTKPLEVQCMYRLQACADSESIVRILNWRDDPDMEYEDPGKKAFDAYRVYLEYCGHSDLHSVLEGYGCRDDDADGEPRRSWIPKPFIWATFESLAKAALLMKRGNLNAAIRGWRDLKLANVFLGTNTTGEYANYPLAKMGDFGLAMEDPYHENPESFMPKQFDRNYRPYGTPDWRAPEQSAFPQGIGIRTQPNSATDIYGIGLVLWSLIKLKLDPDNINDWQDMQPSEQRRPSDFTPEERSRYGEILCDLVMDCLQYLPSRRATPERILQAVRRYTSGDEDQVDGMRSMAAHDRKWDKYFLRSQYDGWARGRVLMETLGDEENLDEDVLLPPRGKRKRDRYGDEYFDDESEESEDYGGWRGEKLRKVEDSDSDETESDSDEIESDEDEDEGFLEVEQEDEEEDEDEDEEDEDGEDEDEEDEDGEDEEDDEEGEDEDEEDESDEE
ncbi:hypothetical protein AC578_5953 [Pseudocercospora eumusae]|uniref:non-specific serine/threonine protein kinase n=1 Tax=Pseudocercospora eumusae TaxID=321146 RepID=A0A139HI37_9PEZI|nr:hypothetical protein AC578_5953 [Pseudocercospora eumusae]